LTSPGAVLAVDPAAELEVEAGRASHFVENFGPVAAMYTAMGDAWTAWQELRRIYIVAQQSLTITSGAEAGLRVYEPDRDAIQQAEVAVLTCPADMLQSTVETRDAARASAVESLTQSVASHLALIQALDQELSVLSRLVGVDDIRLARTVVHSKDISQAVCGMQSFALYNWAALQKVHTEIGQVEQQLREGLDRIFSGAGMAVTLRRGLSLVDGLKAKQRERDRLLHTVGHLCKRFFRLLSVCMSPDTPRKSTKTKKMFDFSR
jgi:hypothetical protein